MRSYEDVAAALSVSLCGECDRYSPYEHRVGAAEGNTVHWTARRLTRPQLWVFLKEVARIRLLRYDEHSPAMRVYLTDTWATKAAAALHIRFPRSYARDDRTYFRWRVALGDPASPEARRWAYRKDIS